MNSKTASKPRRPRRSRKEDNTVSVETEGNVVTLTSGRTVVSGVTPPKRKGGPGRHRTPTEFDDLIPEWNDGEWKFAEASDEDEMNQVYDDIRKAADYHNLGVTRTKAPEGPGVYFLIHEKLARGPRGKRKSETNGDSAEEVE